MSGRLRVLVACEESQEVCKAFRAKGHEAYSCDLQDCSGGHPEWHIKADALEILKLEWDLIIAHPPCTYLSNAGARWLYAGKQLNEERYQKGLDGKDFFMQFFNAKCERIAIENPIPSSVYQMPQYTQVIEPYYFGEPWSKKRVFGSKVCRRYSRPKSFMTTSLIAHRAVIAETMTRNTREHQGKAGQQKPEARLSRVLPVLWQSNGGD